jgi:hypothetical protein
MDQMFPSPPAMPVVFEMEQQEVKDVLDYSKSYVEPVVPEQPKLPEKLDAGVYNYKENNEDDVQKEEEKECTNDTPGKAEDEWDNIVSLLLCRAFIHVIFPARKDCTTRPGLSVRTGVGGYIGKISGQQSLSL